MRRRIAGLTRELPEAIDEFFGERDENGRRIATERMTERAIKMMAKGLSPDEYMARHGRSMIMWAGSRNVYADPTVQAWVDRAAEVWSNPELLAMAEEQFLVGDELEAARQSQAESKTTR